MINLRTTDERTANEPMHITPDDLRGALRRAESIRPRSYAPYSNFRAGAVVLDDDRRSHDGIIVENVSLGLAMCAERVALFGAMARGGSPQAVALVAPRTDGRTTWPCGACLQIALELGGPSMIIAAAAPDDLDALDDLSTIRTATVAELLPNGPHRAASG